MKSNPAMRWLTPTGWLALRFLTSWLTLSCMIWWPSRWSKVSLMS